MSWAETAERGAAGPTRAALALVRRFGWRAGRPMARAAALWFLLLSPRARAASRDYLGRVLGRAARQREVLRHFGSFAASVLDRVMLLCGRDDDFTIIVDGLPALARALDRGGGAILLGAHLGSFEMLRTLATRAPVPVWALMWRRNGGALTAALDAVAPARRERVIEIGDTASMLRARECLERGEIVGLLADRAPPGSRTVPVRFLGDLAAFPAGPFQLAATLGAPVFLCYALRIGPRRYRIGIEPFAERLALRRGRRDEDLRLAVARFAAALERLCRANPYQWFNFFPFWTEPHEPHPARRRRQPAPFASRPG